MSSINYKNTYKKTWLLKKGTQLFSFFFSFRQVLEKNDLVTNNLLTSSFGWILYQVASDSRHSTKNLNEHKKKNLLKCKLGSFTCPRTRIRIVHFTVFVCEIQVSALPLQFLVVPSLKNKRFALPAAI